MIPQKIYYAWFGDNDEPQSVLNNILSWKKYFPAFEIVRIDESNFDVTQNPFIAEAYRQKKWAFVSDFARYKTIYDNGGIYFDTDVEVIHNFEEIFQSRHHSFWALENSNLINSGLFFAAEPYNPDVLEIVHFYERMKLPVDFTVGTPQIVTDYFGTQGFNYLNKYQVVGNGALIFPTQYFSPLHWWGGGRVSKKALTIHHNAGSWVDEGSNIGRWRVRINRLRNYTKQEFILHMPKLYYRYKSKRKE